MVFSCLELQFLSTIYGPDNLGALVAGGFSPAPVLSSVEDYLDDPDLTAPGPSSVALTALLMLAKAIGTSEAFEVLRQNEHFAIIEIQAVEWVAPLTTMMSKLLAPFGKVVQNPPTSMLDEKYFGAPFHILVSSSDSSGGYFARDLVQRSKQVDSDYLAMLASRRPMVALVLEGQSPFPETIANLSDSKLYVVPPDTDLVGKLLHIMRGPDGASMVRGAERLTPTDFVVAFRSRRDAGAYLNSLTDTLRSSKSLQISKSQDSGLDDLIGVDPLKEWGRLLKLDMDAVRTGEIKIDQLPRGALVSGPPGTGKSKGAVGIARYAGLPVIFGSVARWLGTGEGHLGSFCKAMRAAFSDAAKSAPCLMIIDELDALPTRGQDNQHFWDAAIAALLEALDGLDNAPGVVTLGICNDPSNIDPALLRAGRIDHRINIEKPNVGELAVMLKHCLRPHLQDMDFRPLAAQLIGGTIADIDRICKDARRLARNERRNVAFDDVLAVVEQSRSAVYGGDVRRTALHEAGHALLAHLSGFKVHWISASMNGLDGNLGKVMTQFPSSSWTIDHVRAAVRYLLAGQAAEIAILGKPAIGSGSDLQLATEILSRAIGTEGIAETLVWHHPARVTDPTSSTKLAASIEANLRSCQEEAIALLTKHQVALERLCSELIEREFLDDAAIATLLFDVPSNQFSGAAE